MSYHSPSSDLSRLNQANEGETLQVHPRLTEVLEIALRLCVESAGVFDPGIAPVLVQRGFLPSPPLGRPFCAMAGSSVRNISVVEPGVVMKLGPALLDLGGIAKGYAVDEALSSLVSSGVSSALVNAGGDMRAWGNRDFPFQLRHPKSRGVLSQVFFLRNEACATSATLPEAPTFPFIDPRSQEPVAKACCASVVAQRAVIADALTKVLIVRGNDAIPLMKSYRARIICGGDLALPIWHTTQSEGGTFP